MAKKKTTTKRTVGKTRKPKTPTETRKNKSKPQVYDEFVYFMALPRTLRQETMELEGDTMLAFAAKYKVNKNTLTTWKNKAGFWDDVQRLRKDFFRARTADVILALETKNLNPDKASGQDVRVLLTYTGEYSDKLEQEHKIHPDLQKALDKIGKVLD